MALTGISQATLILGIVIIHFLNPALGLYKNSFKYEQYQKKLKSHNEYKTCSEQSIEAREELANVVFTGTIRGIFPDFKHPNMKRAKVEIKRVFKGENVIIRVPGISLSNSNDLVGWHRRLITLEGLGDPKICHSEAHKYDTRIFLANLNGSGNLKLNSSVVRLTMDNIMHAEAAVKDIPFTPATTDPPAPCERIYCAYGAQCVVNENQEATCKCIQKCPSIFAPVCGSNNVTYSSDCHLRVASCSSQKRIRAEFQGSCDVKDPCLEKKCSFGAFCVPSLDGLIARCQCPDRCDNYGDSVGSVPICGNDGRDYHNLCEMKRASCIEMIDKSIKYHGRCDPCEGKECPASQVCQLDKNRKPECKCNTVCPSDLAIVCGSDGRSYSNECVLRSEACKLRKEINVLFRGECTSGDHPCDRLSCGPGEECRVDRNGEARCICPPTCEQVLRPVCGSDGVTYDNECELKRQSCQAGRTNSIAFRGECSKDGPCSMHKCLHGALCVVQNGSPGCECPSCSEEYQPVCGSDGMSYSNECKLKAENCETRRDVTVAYQGLCNGCKNQKCDYYSICESDGKGMASCVCPTSCVQVKNEVCGTNGVTYMNECELRVASCEAQQFIMITSQGPCDICANVKCPFGARCENGHCVCPQRCPDNNDPVCANDGETYGNDCEMRRQSCSQGIELEMVHSGECEGEASGSGGESGMEVCDETSCRYGGTCDYDAEGPAALCVCNFNCDAIRSPVCGSDGKTYGNECLMREESCRRQTDISAQDMDNCEDQGEEMCDGKPALVNNVGREYDCGADRDTCPSGSYCHRLADGLARCCREDQAIRSCQDTRYGCCSDHKTIAPGPQNAGCPSVCQCNQLGSFGMTCDPVSLQCTCKPGVGGQRCDRCEPGFWGLPKIADGNSGCISCGCNTYGSLRDDCEQMTGRCVCKVNITGQKCNLCPDGKVLGPGGCTDAKSATARNCRDLRCRYGASCVMKKYGEPFCECPDTCESEESPIPVCGTNGQTYGSRCQLKFYACRRQEPNYFAYEGTCQGDRSRTTTPLPTTRMTTRSRKTTRDLNKPPHQAPTPSGPEDGVVGAFCLYDLECEIENSYCHQGICTCKEGLSPSTDNTECQGESWQHTPLLPITFPATSPRVMGSAIPSFSGNSYLQVKKYHHGNKMITIDIEFRTLSREGILLYAAQSMDGKGDFVSLAIKDGYVEFRYDLGSGAAIIKSRMQVTLNKFHHVTAKRFGKDGMLKFDGGDTSGVSTGTLQSLNLDTPLFLGYVPNANPEIFRNIGVNKGFVGCIDSLVLDSDVKKIYDLTYPGRSMDIEEGFGITECGDNRCLGLPCLNHGTCTPISNNDFHCDCPTGYTGTRCELVSKMENMCKSRPCQHGGTCTQLPDGGFFCSCTTGRHGDTCQHGLNGGITVPEFHGDSHLKLKLNKNLGREFNYEIWFLSTKPNGVIVYSEQEGTERGDFLSLNLVNGYLQLRYNLGSGLANITSAEPLSLNSWHQVEISRVNRAGDMTIDEGHSIRGHSQGELKQLNLPLTLFLGGHQGGYNQESGIRSGLHGAIQRFYESGQLREDLVSGAVDRERLTQYIGPPCESRDNPCQNGGSCMPHLNHYICKCPPKYAGRQCESVTNDVDTTHPVAFDGRTHHRYPNRVKTKQRSQNSNKIEIQFRTSANEGLILLVHKSSSVEGDYLSIAIIYGRIEVSFNLGKENPNNLLLIKSNVRVNDGKWHTLLFVREKRQAALTVDNGPALTAVSNTGATQLDTDGNLWIGGSRSIPSGLPSTYSRGFDGCIRSVQIDDEPLNLVQDLNSHGRVQFCPL